MLNYNKYGVNGQDNISIDIYTTFGYDLPILAKFAEDSPELEKLVMNAYEGLCKINYGLPLMPLPTHTNIKLDKYPLTLSEYFRALPRLYNITVL